MAQWEGFNLQYDTSGHSRLRRLFPRYAARYYSYLDLILLPVSFLYHKVSIWRFVMQRWILVQRSGPLQKNRVNWDLRKLTILVSSLFFLFFLFSLDMCGKVIWDVEAETGNLQTVIDKSAKQGQRIIHSITVEFQDCNKKSLRSSTPQMAEELIYQQVIIPTVVMKLTWCFCHNVKEVPMCQIQWHGLWISKSTSFSLLIKNSYLKFNGMCKGHQVHSSPSLSENFVSRRLHCWSNKLSLWNLQICAQSNGLLFSILC